jgi:3-keto-5-aminohexanoate cleavage enzyme
MRKVIIECAVNGATKRSANPSTPYSVAETVADSLAASEAGAAIIHYHVLGPQGEWSDDIVDYGAVARGIRASSGIGAGALLWPTFAPGVKVSERFGHFIELARDPATRPDLGACDMGSLNVLRWDVHKGEFGRTPLYQNTLETCREALALMTDIGLKVSTLQIFEPTHLRMTLKFLQLGLVSAPLLLKFYLGGQEQPFGLPPTVRALEAYLEILGDAPAVWFGACLGGDVIPLVPHIVSMGGHVRVGLEDYHYAQDGQLTNAQMVERAATIVRAIGCEVATPDETRAMLGI